MAKIIAMALVAITIFIITSSAMEEATDGRKCYVCSGHKQCSKSKISGKQKWCPSGYTYCFSMMNENLRPSRGCMNKASVREMLRSRGNHHVCSYNGCNVWPLPQPPYAY